MLLKLADTVFILINPSPSNVKVQKKESPVFTILLGTLPGNPHFTNPVLITRLLKKKRPASQKFPLCNPLPATFLKVS